MNDQISMFDPAPKYVAHSPTSKAAAVQIEPKANTLRAKVYDLIKVSSEYGATDEELQDILCMEGSTERPRRKELCEQGKVKDSGKTRKTKSGRQAVIWVAV